MTNRETLRAFMESGNPVSGVFVIVKKNIGTQKYEAVEVSPHINRFGENTIIVKWLSQCRKCGEDFYVTAGAHPTHIVGTCKKHRQTVRGGSRIAYRMAKIRPLRSMGAK
jgi:hypothetical protein